MWHHGSTDERNRRGRKASWQLSWRGALSLETWTGRWLWKKKSAWGVNTMRVTNCRSSNWWKETSYCWLRLCRSYEVLMKMRCSSDLTTGSSRTWSGPQSRQLIGKLTDASSAEGHRTVYWLAAVNYLNEDRGQAYWWGESAVPARERTRLRFNSDFRRGSLRTCQWHLHFWLLFS